MRLTITGRGIKLTPAVDIYARRKLLGSIQKFLPGKELLGAVAVHIELSRQTAHHRKGPIWRAGVAMEFPGEKNPIFAEATDGDIHAAIDRVAEEVGQLVKRYKGKSAALFRRGARRAKKEVRLDPAARMYRKGRIRDEGS